MLIKDIQQRLHELNAEEARLLASIQVSLAGIERVHVQRRMEELTLVELQGKAEDDKRTRKDKNPQPKKKKKGKQGNQGQPGNNKRGAEEQPEGPEPAKRQRQGGPSNAYGGQGIPVPIPGPSNHGNRNQRHNQSLAGGECKCSRVDVQCEGNASTCQVCQALGCPGVAQSHYRNQNEHHGNAPGVTPAASTWLNDPASIINIDDNIDAMQG